MQALDILKNYWGYDSFRPLQSDIIESVLAGHDTIGLMPTGGGKSITFQVPAMILPGLTIVVTPLISLMKDQVDNLRQRGIKATYLHSGLTLRESNLAIDRCRLGKVKLLYISPEKIQSPRFADTLRLFDVSLIVVDEAHCISQWGHDFRPSYLKIKALRSMFPACSVLALTASATPRVIDDIALQLSLKAPAIFTMSFSRSNISYLVRRDDDKEGKMLQILNRTSGTAIVYVRSRKRSGEIAQLLQRNGITALNYHAGLLPEEKNERQNAWKDNSVRVIVATNAFGMGIDKPDVRLVIHLDVPPSLEEYYQEAGRAGRDGEPSFAVLITSRHDRATLHRRISEAFPPLDVVRRVYELVGNFLDIAVGEGYNRLCDFNIAKFCSIFNYQPRMVDACLRILTQAGYIDYTDEMTTRARVMVLMQRHELYDLQLSHEADRVLQALLRTSTGIFADYQHINEREIARRLNLSDEDVYQTLLLLGRQHIIHYIPRKVAPYILYTTSRETPQHLTFPRKAYALRREHMEQRIKAMDSYAFDDTTPCRVNLMLNYFGETPTEYCNNCDQCRARNIANRSRQQTQNIEDALQRRIIHLASKPQGIDSATLVATLNDTKPELILNMVRELIDRESLILRDNQLFYTQDI